MADLEKADAGDYSCTISNSFGSVTSAVATLRIAAVPPRLLLDNGTFGYSSNRFGFNVGTTTNVGQTLVIEGSTNLSDWTPLETNLLDTEPLHFNDPASTNLPLRFYRGWMQ